MNKGERELFLKLRQPFEDSALKWKVQTNPKEGEGDMFALCVAYIDARDVAARLNEVVGINWESNFGDIISFTDGKKTEYGVRCHLTVLGHTRTDIGTLPATEPLKGGYSDALKRAAVQFGIAAYVYAFPTVKAEVQKFGRSYYFTANAKKELAQLVQAIHAGAERLPKFHALQVRNYAPILFDSPYFGGEEEQSEMEPEPGNSLKCESEGCEGGILDYVSPQGKVMSAARIAEGTRAEYGKVLCWGCAQDAKAAKAAREATPGVTEAPQKPANDSSAPTDKEAAKNALVTARTCYEDTAASARVLGLLKAHGNDYLGWITAKLDSETNMLLDTIQDAIRGTAFGNDKFCADDNNEVPHENASLRTWMDFAQAWELINIIREDALHQDASMVPDEMLQ